VHENLWKTIDLSVADLEEAELSRFIELLVFEADDPIPEAAIHTLWGHSGAMPRDDRVDLLDDLMGRHLLEGSGTIGQPNATFRIHDIVYAFVRRLVDGSPHPAGRVVRSDPRTMKDLHNLFLDAYRKACADGWPSGPDDGYFFSHLRNHLDRSGRTSELADLALSRTWLEAKLRHTLIGDAVADLRTAHRGLPEADGRRGTLKTLELALQKDIDFINRYRNAYPQGLLQCLWNRLCTGPTPSSGATEPSEAVEAAAELVRAWRHEWSHEHGSEAFLSINQGLPDPLQSNLIRVFRSPSDEDPEAGGGALVYAHSLDISADESLLACYVSGAESAIRIWKMKTGAFVGSLPLGDLKLSSLRFEPSGAVVVGVGHDATVRCWDCRLKEEIAELTAPVAGSMERRTVSAIAADGRLVAVGSADGEALVWDRGEQKQLRRRQVAESEVTALAFDLACRRLLVGDQAGTVSVYDARSGEPQLRWAGRGSRITSLASDGNRVYIGSADGHVIEWQCADNSSTELFTAAADSIASLALDRSATRLGWSLGAAQFRPYAIDRSIYIKDVSPANAGTLQLDENPSDVFCLVIRGALVAGAGNDWQPHLWDAALKTFPSRGALIWVGDLQDAGADWLIAGGDDQTARIYERRTLDEVVSCRHGGTVWSAIVLAETATRPATDAIPKAARRAPKPSARPVSLNKTIITVTAGEGDRLKIWDAFRQRELAGIASLAEGTMMCRGTRDRAHLVFGNGLLNLEGETVDWSNYPQDLTLWSAEAGEKVGSFHVNSAMELREEIIITPDNHLLITALDHRRLGVWSLWAGGMPQAVGEPCRNQILAVAVHPAGRLVAAGDISGNIYIYSLDLKLVHPIYNTHQGYVRGLAFTDDGNYLVSGSDDQTMKIWSTSGYTLRGCVELGRYITCLTTSFGLMEVILGLGDGNLRSVRLEGPWDWGPPIVTAGRRWRVTGYTEEAGQAKLVGRWSKRASATCPFCGREVIASGAVLKAVAEWDAKLGGDKSPCLALPDEAWGDGRLRGKCPGCSKELRWNPFQVQAPGRN
jgi:WD40 repeat protein